MEVHFSGSQSSLREANKALLLNTITHYGAMTQVELAENTGLSTATVSNLVHQLVDDGIFETTSTIRSGRRALMVAIKRQLGLGIGLYIGRHSLRICITDFSSTILASHTLPLRIGHHVDSTTERAILLIKETIDNIGAQLEETVGISIAVSAPVDWKSQRISVPGILYDWDNIDIATSFTQTFHVPVIIDNDANLAAFAEARRGNAQGIDNFVYIQAGDGIGSGIFINGKLWRGATGMAGEIGHVQVDPLGNICTCGNRGCLDTVVSADRLISLLSVTHGNLTLDDLIDRSIEGDPGCRRVIADAAIRIGTVAADMCVAIDPQVIVLGGSLSKSGETFTNPFQESLQRLLFPNVLSPIKVIPSKFTDTNAEYGAALLALENSTSHGEITDESNLKKG